MAGSPIRPICRPICTPIIRGINTLVGNSAFSPLSVFSGGKVGALYDSKGWQNTSSPTGLWQDSGRTTPVTALGQPVGAIDDSSGNGYHLIQATGTNRGTFAGTPSTFGSNLVSNGDFASGTGWTTGTGWSIAAGVASHTGATGNLDTTVAFAANTLYRVTYTVSNWVSGQIATLFVGGASTVTATYRGANGTYVQYLRAEAGNTTLRFQSFSTFQMDIDNVEVVAVTAYAAPYGVFMDGVDDIYTQSASFTMQMPMYTLFTATKYLAANTAFFGARLDNTNYFLVRNSTSGTGSGASNLLSTARGASSTTAGVNEWPLNQPAVIDSLALVGTTDHQINNNASSVVANTWLAPDTVAASKMTIAIATNNAVGTMLFLGGMLVVADPDATNRAKLKTYFGAVAGLTL